MAIFTAIKTRFGGARPVVPVVRLSGIIAAESRPGRLNIETVAPLLKRAFDVKQAPAIAIVVNSPGGSPVQSRLIAKRIRDLAREKSKPVLVFIEDAAASGGYFIATAGDEIFADPSSIVGSIGVIHASFGFVEAIEKLGVERRVHTAGRSKSTLDPFLPEKPDDVARLRKLEDDVHTVFIDWVKLRRGDRLTTDEDLFTGEFWTGLRGRELGLVDEIGDLHEVLRARFGDRVKLRMIQPKRGLFALPRLGLAVADMLEERLAWASLGIHR